MFVLGEILWLEPPGLGVAGKDLLLMLGWRDRVGILFKYQSLCRGVLRVVLYMLKWPLV